MVGHSPPRMCSNLFKYVCENFFNFLFSAVFPFCKDKAAPGNPLPFAVTEHEGDLSPSVLLPDLVAIALLEGEGVNESTIV